LGASNALKVIGVFRVPVVVFQPDFIKGVSQ